MNNKKGFILSTYVYMLLVFFLLLLTTMLTVMNNSKLLSNKLKEQSSNTSGLTDKDYSFILLGESDMIIRKGEEYIEPGFKIQTVKGVDLSDIVSITGNVDVNLPNTYKLTYSATYNGITKRLTRNVTVLDNTASNYIAGLYKHKKDENNLINPKAAYNNIEYDTGIRYSGADPNNYVYFNCDDKDSNNINYGEDNYNYKNSCETWRIIGVFDVDNGEGNIEKRVKLVRSKLLTDTQYWDTNDDVLANQWGETTLIDGVTTYDGATLMQYLNNEFYNDFGVNMKSFFSESLWYTGGISFENDTVLRVSASYNYERGGLYGISSSLIYTTKWIGKIGLIYPSDYGYANPKCDNLLNVSCGEKNWLNIEAAYWTITHDINTDANTLDVYTNGRIYGNGCGYRSYGVNPSLYLKSSIKITSGDGTQESPYKLSI